jgi:hypothetical protein
MVRLGIAPLLLGTVIVLAWMLNREVDIWFIRIARYLAAYEGFHILMHLLIFGSVPLLMGSGAFTRKRQWIMWGTVIVGAVGIEIAQVWATGFDEIDGIVIWAAVFDLIVDSIGVIVGLMIREWTIPKSGLA